MLNKANLEIAKLASKEKYYQDRPMAGLYVSPSETCATDGKALVIVGTPDMPEDQFPETEGITPVHDFKPFIISSESALEVGKAIPKTNIPIINFAVVSAATDINGSAVLATNDLKNPKVFTPKKIEGTFPNYRVCVPDADKAKLKIGFDLTLLARTLTQLEKIANETSSIKSAVFSFTDATSPLRIDCQTEQGQHITAVVMPCQL